MVSFQMYLSLHFLLNMWSLFREINDVSSRLSHIRTRLQFQSESKS